MTSHLFLHMVDNEETIEIVRTIVMLVQNLGMDVIGEGVETTDQLALLRALASENGQGFLFSYPLGAEEICRVHRQHSKSECPAWLNRRL